MISFTGIDVSDIDYGRYPDEAHQKKWIEIYLQESALCEGVRAYVCYYNIFCCL